MSQIVRAAVALTLLAASAPALAQNAPSQSTPVAETPSERVVLICARGEDTRRAFRREYGEAPIFLTAEQAMRTDKSEVWTAPRCMTAQEHARFERMRAEA